MTIKVLKPQQALNKAFLKVKPNRVEIERFKTNLIQLFNSINDSESEEFHKNLVSDFLKRTWYEPLHFINTKGRNDLVVHNGTNASSTVGLIMEAKKPGNRAEMVKPFMAGDSPEQIKSRLNAKAMQELVLYYLRERITHKNLEVKHLVITNIYEWFVFDAILIDRLFAQSKALVQQFIDFEAGRLADTKTDFFYKQVAAPFMDAQVGEVEYTYFNLQAYEKKVRNADKTDDTYLIALYKLLSPEHLLKKSFVNDSNSLDKRFYSELLHIIGLTETKEGSKKLIERNKEGERHSGTLLEDSIMQLDSLDKISRLDKPGQFGATQAERLFNVGLELSITWINRVLFLKLLEAQQITYHKGDKSFAFLNLDKIKNYDDLNSLFFQVLARRNEERNPDVKRLFEKVPYLNSSLFEPTEIEHNTLFISNLRNDKPIPIHPQTVLKDGAGRKMTGQLPTLDYLFRFLNAYDFGSEGAAAIQEDNKTLINASVLGLIFEKINGYKDGSFFTPGFITMYMCRETIRKAVVQKFNETKGWQCTSLNDVYDKIDNRSEANSIVNSLKICDPAVGSGHFLVSALNELIAVKNDLKILQDRDGKRLKEYQVEVVNDELIVTDEEGGLFAYNPHSKESQRIQETLFHEKQALIENCLFGVDINPNSVKICRLRLWIELLKNAYYKNATELETLPNIDINIKCGNSLVSRFAMNADLKQALKKSKWTIDGYRAAVSTYRNATNKEQKKEMEGLILKIKQSFSSEIRMNDPIKKRLDKIAGELYYKFTGTFLFEPEVPYSKKDEQTAKARKAEQESLEKEVEQLNRKMEEIRNNKIFEQAFEWRFEFPEVLNDSGDFIGFDVVIGNPPYGIILTKDEDSFFRLNYKVSNYQIDSYTLFTELGMNIGTQKSNLTFIIPSAWSAAAYDYKFREYLVKNRFIQRITICPKVTFEDAVVETCIIECAKKENSNVITIYNLGRSVLNELDLYQINAGNSFILSIHSTNKDLNIIKKIKNDHPKLFSDFEVIWGIKIYENGKGKPPQTGNESKLKSFHSKNKLLGTHMPLIGGSEIFPYDLKWKGGYVNYGSWLAAPRTPDWFSPEPRIVVREVTSKGRIFATIIEEEMVFSNSVDGIRSKTKNITGLKMLLGILNSRLASYYHLNTSPNSQKGSFPKVLLQDLRELPIPQDKFQLKTQISQLVDEILKSERLNKETQVLEWKIDQLVYQLYNLTEEEIAIIENSTK